MSSGDTRSATPPAFVAALPAPVRKMLRQQCQGDWRRVTRDPDGSVVVHNRPVEPDVRPAHQPNPKPKPNPRPKPAPRPAGTARSARPPRRVASSPANSPRPKPPAFPDPPGFNSMTTGILIKPRTKPDSRKRSGAPRTAVELLKRLLDLGCQYERIPGGPKARVFYYGYQLGLVWSADNTPRNVVRDEYRRMRKQVQQIDEFYDRALPRATGGR